MCGIAGVVGMGDAEAAGVAVRRMTSALERRGPDGSGCHSWSGAVLGHRRLAIIDLSPAGAQPMLSEDGSVGVSFNGCIYNFLSLREELAKHGAHFRSHCDTEILVEGYRAWGIDELARRIHGMFAFALWDETLETLYLVRDRLGVKPLLFSVADARIAFASTADALRAAGFAGSVNSAAVLEFLELGFVPEETAVFENIDKLAPATILEWRKGKMSERSYWRLPEPDSTTVSFDLAVEQTEAMVLDAVRMRLIADVPVGALLSGGIDSTLVCWAMAKLGADAAAFTVGTEGSSEDESADAVDTARRLGLPHRLVQVGADSPEVLDELTAAYSEPFAVESALGMLLVSRAVRPWAKVLLTGDGGDDVYLGYPFLRNALTAERLARAIPDVAAPIWSVARKLTPEGRARNFGDYSIAGLRAHVRAHDGLPWFAERRLLGSRLAGCELARRELPPSRKSAKRLLADVLRYHWRTHFTGEFLPKVDAGTMFWGLEARAPFLDSKLWEFAAALPFSTRFHRGELKAILREIVRRRVGVDVAQRRKRGFSIPVQRLLAGPWSGKMEILERGGTLLEDQGWIVPGRLAGEIAEAKRAGRVPVQIWRLLVLERWLRSRAN